MSEKTKLRVKLGDFELCVEGDADAVEKESAAFYGYVKERLEEMLELTDIEITTINTEADNG